MKTLKKVHASVMSVSFIGVLYYATFVGTADVVVITFLILSAIGTIASIKSI